MSAPAATEPTSVAIDTVGRHHGGYPGRVGPCKAQVGGSAAPGACEHGERFAAYVAHELRTPLAAERTLLELALADPNTDAAGWREIGENVLLACRQQERLLEACLTLARSQGRLPRLEPVDLAAIAADALQAHDPRGLGRVVALESTWAPVDPDLLERLAANLVSNAIRNNIVGGRIEVATRAGLGRAHLTVINTGPLIPATELERLFRPFQRLNNPTTFNDGVGLGLAIVEAIAAAHNGFVTARTRAGGGLEVDVSLPGIPEPTTAQTKATGTAATNRTIPPGSAPPRRDPDVSSISR